MPPAITFFLKKNRSIIIATIVYFITCILLYMVQYKVYGGVIKTGVILFALFPIAGVVSWFLREEKDEIQEKNTWWTKIKKIFSWIYYIPFSILLVYVIYQNPFYLQLYLAVVAVIAICVLDLIYKKHRETPHNPLSKFLITTYLAISITTMLFCFIVNICTLNQAKNTIAENGYNDISYITNVDTANDIDFLTSGTVPKDNNDNQLGYYLFQAKKSDSTYMVFINPISKNIFYEEQGMYEEWVLRIIKGH